MGKAIGIFCVLLVILCAGLASPPRNEGQVFITESAEIKTNPFLTTVRKQWFCVNDQCEEHITTCTNKVCDTTKNRYKSDNYQPQPPIYIPEPPTPLDISQIFDFSKLPLFNVSAFDNSGLIDLVTNAKNFTYYWSNSKHVNKNCHNNVCTITTKSCTNGKCEEKTAAE